MAPNPESVKDKIWSLSSTSLVSGSTHMGGAFCASKSGLLVATTFGVCPRTKLVMHNGSVEYLFDPAYFNVRATDSNGRTWQVKLVQNFSEFGLLLYQLVKENPGDEFGFVNLDSVNQEESSCADVFSYLHHNRLTYSTLTSNKSYPSPPTDLIFHDNISNLTVEHLTETQKSNLYFARLDTSAPYRMVENTVDLDACDPIAEEAVLPEAAKLYTKLPLLQFSGLGIDTYKGSSGCSVFSMEDNRLIGLILFNLDSACFVLPLSVLRHCFNKYETMNNKDGQGEQGGGSGVGGGLTW